MTHTRIQTRSFAALAGCLLLAAALVLLAAAPSTASPSRRIDTGLREGSSFDLTVKNEPSRRSVFTLREGDAAEGATEGAAAWTKIGATGASPVTALAFEPGTPARLYAGTNGAGLWLTSNGGGSWSNPLAANVAALCQAPGAIYAGAWTEGVLKSTDHGAHWTAVITGLAANDVYALAVDPANANTVYAGTEAGVFKSSDAGAHWSFSAGGPVGKVYALAFAGQTLVAGTSSGAWRLAGGTWQAANEGLGGNEVYALATGAGTIYAGTEWGVRASTDGGLHWLPAPSGLPAGPVRALAADASGRAVLAGTDQGVYVSELGAAWQQLNSGLSGWALAIGALAVDMSQPAWQVYAGTADGVYQLAWAPYATPTPTPSVTPTATSSPTPTASRTSTPSKTPTPSRTPLYTLTPTPTATPGGHNIWLPRALKRN